MSENLSNKFTLTHSKTKPKGGLRTRVDEQQNQQIDSEQDLQSDDSGKPKTYSEAKRLCEEQMQELQQKIQFLSTEEQQNYIEQAQLRCARYLANFQKEDDESEAQSQENEYMENNPEQQQLMALQQLKNLGLAGLAGHFNATPDIETQQNPYFQSDNQNPINAINDQFLHQQNVNMFLQQMGQSINQKEIFAQIQSQYRQTLRQQMGNQLRNFSIQMFSKINARQKNKLFQSAKIYLDQYVIDQKKLQQQMNSASTNPSMIGSGNAFIDSSGDFEYKADPHKFLDQVESTLRKHKDLASNFQRFIQKVFDDPEQEQVFTDFMINYQEVYALYHSLAINFTYAQHQEDEDQQEALGTQIFNLIMPFAQQIDPKLLNLIPKEILEKFKIEYESDNVHIRSWEMIEQTESNSSSDKDINLESSQSESESSINDQNITSNSQLIGDISDDDDVNNDFLNDRNRLKDKNGQLGDRFNDNQQALLSRKNRSLISQLNYTYPILKNIKSIDIRPLDNLFKFLKDERDWIAFCKLLFLYFEGVFSLTEFLKLYEEKFSTKLKQDLKDEIEKLIPTRDNNRRALSNILKPWNDTENQTFEKIPDSSYYKIEEGFPIPYCTRKMMDDVYLNNLNDQYLSLATGSENFKFKFRNTYEELIYKTEDKIYELDSQIDNISKCYNIISKQCDLFEGMSEENQATYRFPIELLNPFRFYWDQKFRKSIIEIYIKDGKILKSKELQSLKQQFSSKLEFLKNQRSVNINDHKDNFRKNFTKSLDHKSFQYKDFIKKYQQKQNHIIWIKQILEDNFLKRRLTPNQINILYGSGEQSNNSDFRFLNTFGKDFSGKFDQERLKVLDKNPDHPIDMKFMDKLSINQIQKIQHKCPQSRFLMNNQQAFDITLKLIIQFIKMQQPTSSLTDKSKLMKALKFMVVKFLKFENFEECEALSETIKPINADMIDILMNSALYYQKKYKGEINHMQEVFPIEDPSLLHSPVKQASMQNSETIKNFELSKVNSEHSQSDDEQVQEQPNSQDSTQFKPLSIKKQKMSEEEQLMQDIFIPRYANDKNKNHSEKYQLFYAPLNVYMFLVFFYSIYERIIKAKELVSKKVRQDFKDDFSQMEWSIKFSKRIQTLIDERFSYLIKAILTLMSQNNVLDSQKYEDIARELLGNDAYLLFQIDKLINYCQKQLQLFEIDNNFIASKKLFQDFLDGKMEDESQYLSNFYKIANQQALASKDIIHQKNNDKTPLLNKENMNPNMNLQAFRIMYSPKSRILTAHFMVLHPFFLQEQKKISNAPQPIQCRIPINPINGEINEQETVNGLYGITTHPMQLDDGPLPLGEVDVSPQIYLNRNLKKMQAVRARDNKQIVKNNMKMCLVPLTHQITFEANTEDIVMTRRWTEKTRSHLIKRKFSQIVKDQEFHEMAHQALLKKLKTINQQTGHHDINILLEMEQQELGQPKNSQISSNNQEQGGKESKASLAVTTRKTRSVTNSNQKQQPNKKGNDGEQSQKY